MISQFPKIKFHRMKKKEKAKSSNIHPPRVRDVVPVQVIPVISIEVCLIGAAHSALNFVTVLPYVRRHA
jgi:hypothetical protein